MAAIAADRDLTEAALRVAMALRGHLNHTTRDAYPSQERLAGETNLTERAVRSGLKALVERGHLHKLARFGRNGTRRYGIPSTGTVVPHRPEPSFRQTPEEPQKEPQSERARATSSKCSVDDKWPDGDPSGLMAMDAKAQLSISQERADRVVAKFFAHHRSKGTRSECWPSEWQRWLLNEADFQERGQAHA